MSGRKQDTVKVVLMDTQYVQTDSRSFKTVVQELTGKDCCVNWIKESSSSTSTVGSGHVENDETKSVSKMTLTRGFSFKDLDRMMSEVPPPEELQRLWNEYIVRY